MKIGTVTYWWTQTNYGQVLQCFALIKFLQNHGHDAFLIKNQDITINRITIPILWNKTIKAVKYIFSSKYRKARIEEKRIWNEIIKAEQEDIELHPRKFDIFRAKFIPSTSSIYSYEELKKNPPSADAYICGSDQIWAGTDPVYFLQFGNDNTKKIAYATSMGGIKAETNRVKLLKKYLTKFAYISSREQSDVDLLHQIGYKEAALVPDPTLLLPPSVYREIESNQIKTNEEPYIFVYLLGNPIDVSIDEIYVFAHKHNLKVKYVAAQGKKDQHAKLYPSIEQWLEMIDKAKYVITNSFHGTVFSLILNTPFMSIPITGKVARMNNRITTLLSHSNLMSRMYHESLDEILEPISFNDFNQMRESKEKEIEIILNKILS